MTIQKNINNSLCSSVKQTAVGQFFLRHFEAIWCGIRSIIFLNKLIPLLFGELVAVNPDDGIEKQKIKLFVY